MEWFENWFDNSARRDMEDEPIKFTQKIHRLLRARPFRSFRLYLSDGSEFEVRHPESALLTQGGLYIGRYADEQSEIPESDAFCSLLHMTRVEVDERANAG
ncbi:hypothetical protein [Stratiformator vulcanicus]|uniref:Uncharacterized protein n=1 Tax=Stratiformator vulcanicus TaxID=2527980 RepID=A0A517R7A6_9PLAN|nr:hypothetical protein [Stratiformator vulcanicus]QDT39701.1 hypothetical protein Pan189_41100 [Stratiformator vulcanicus]